MLDLVRPNRPLPPGRGRFAALSGRRASLLLVISGLILGTDAVVVSLHAPSASAAVPVSDAGTIPAPTAGAVGTHQGPNPASLRIPAIGVKTSLLRLGVDKKGVLDVPKDFAKAGWWTGGARPGDNGTAVIVGHIDSYTGSAVFYRLRDLKPGQQVEVTRADRSRAVFAVDARREYSKGHFPTKTVYAPTPTASLRLITCGGAFDYKTRSYRDNVVVFAHLVRIVG